jgi:Clp amino terminal domain, pathogenicity island component
MNWIKSFWKGLTEKPDGPRITVQRRASALPPGPVDDPAFSNFTPRALQVLALARREAIRLHHHFIGTEHVLLGLITLGDGTAVNVLKKMGIDLETARTEVEKQVGIGLGQIVGENVPYTPRVKKALALAAKQARALNHTYVGTEHVLLGLLAEGDGVAARVLLNLNLNLEHTRDQILAELDPTGTSAPASVSAADKPATSPVTAGSMRPRPDKQPHYVLQQPAGEPVDTGKRFDIYCTDSGRGTAVYRNARFKSMKHLFQRSPTDPLSGFVELEQSDGQTVFVSRSSIVRFCAPGVTPGLETVPGPKV